MLLHELAREYRLRCPPWAPEQCDIGLFWQVFRGCAAMRERHGAAIMSFSCRCLAMSALFHMEAFWLPLCQIIGVNLVLSGDNAVMLALAARALPPATPDSRHAARHCDSPRLPR